MVQSCLREENNIFNWKLTRTKNITKQKPAGRHQLNGITFEQARFQKTIFNTFWEKRHKYSVSL